jgi:hypothetical protein
MIMRMNMRAIGIVVGHTPTMAHVATRIPRAIFKLVSLAGVEPQK